MTRDEFIAAALHNSNSKFIVDELFNLALPDACDAKHRTRNLEIPGLVLRTIPE